MMPGLELRQECCDAFRHEYLRQDSRHGGIVKFVHGHRQPFTCHLAPRLVSCARVIAIPSTLAGPYRHHTVAFRAAGKTGEKNGSRHNARIFSFRVLAFQTALDLLEGSLGDDGRALDPHNLFRGTLLPGCRVPSAETVIANVRGVGEGHVERSDAPKLTAPRPVSMSVQPINERFAPERSGRTIAIEVEVKTFILASRRC